VEVNEEKSRRADLKRGERFSFLGFDFWRVRSRANRWMPLIRPQMKKRTALLRQLKVVFRNLRSQPIRQVIENINPILRGLGPVLFHRTCESMFLVYSQLGRGKDSASLGQSPTASGLRLEAVGPAVVLR